LRSSFEEDVASDLMTKQGEYIRYLEEQKHNLSKQILELSQELENANEHIQSTQAPPPEEVQKRKSVMLKIAQIH
jgi:peptidoglycan hydrolase CwlO-like protein